MDMASASRVGRRFILVLTVISVFVFKRSRAQGGDGREKVARVTMA